jgi:hypothetical protein
MAIVSLSRPDAPEPLATPATTQHAQLCQLAQRWLMRPQSAGGHGCGFAITEGWGDGQGEHPDAIGWRRSPLDGGSILVEVKVSRPDFLADARKPHRAEPALGVGRYRYYLCPEGLIAPEELPPRWGLLYATGRRSVRAVLGPAAMLRHHRRGAPVRTPDGAIVGEYDAWHQACRDFAFEARNHDLETAMLVALLQRVGDPEAANLALRQSRGQVAHLIRELQEARERANSLGWKLFAAHRALEDAGLPFPDPTAAPALTAKPRATLAEAASGDDASDPTD